MLSLSASMLQELYITIATVLSVWFFLTGFLPYSILPGDLPGNSTTRKNATPLSNDDRLVFIVVDALRADFIADNERSIAALPFLHTKIKSGNAYAYTACVQTPTVTMPRLKALLSGTVPAFIDFILNIASPVATEDTLIHVLKDANERVFFYGDDTWLKLFQPPENYFVSYEGVHSFFVSDYTEVDTNVTRHLRNDFLRSRDYRAIFLHYLGLDHIGHIHGPASQLIDSKLTEMDEVIGRIYTETDENTFIVVVGDHGMSSTGNHGGSSLEETRVPIVLLSKKFKLGGFRSETTRSCRVQQVDLVPSVACLLNLSRIPAHNLGVLLSEPVRDMASELRLKECLFQNAQQMNLGFSHDILPVDLLQKLQIKSRNDMEVSAGFNVPRLIAAVMLALSSFVLLIVVNFKLICSLVTDAPILCCFLTMHALSLASSSFVEEEHFVWFWIIQGCVALLLLDLEFCTTIFFLSIHRVSFSWLRHGDKWVEDLAMVDYVSEFSFLSAALPVISLFFIADSVSSFRRFVRVSVFCMLLVVILSCGQFTMFDPFTNFSVYIWTARAFFVLCCCFLVTGNLKSDFVALPCALLCKPNKLPVLLLVIYMLNALERFPIHNQTRTLLLYFLAHSSFFILGNSHSINTLDLYPGYVGLSSYHPVVTCFLMLVGLYIGPLLCFSRASSDTDFLLITCIRYLPFCFYLLVCFTNRYHLFVWSVFAPKLLYECSHIVFLSLAALSVKLYRVCCAHG